MTSSTTVLSSTAELTTAAASALRQRLATGAELAVELTREIPPLPAGDGGSAVVVGLRGRRGGELTLVLFDSAVAGTGGTARSVNRQLGADLAAELGFDADDTMQVIDARLAVNALLADPGTLPAVLTGRGGVAAVIGLKLSEAALGAPVTSTAAPALNPERLHLLRGVEMAVTAEIGRTRMTVGELLNLTEGAVIELDRPAGAPADLLVNGRLIARGEVVVIDENFALRVTDIVNADEER